MSDLPMPQDAAAAAQFADCWDPVLAYADLCTAGSAAAARLATEAFTRGLREAHGAGSARAASGTGRRPVRLLPRIPALLTAVRVTAASWEATGRGDDLAPDFRRWLNSARAARYTGPPSRRPLALRALRDMQSPDAELLWLAEVEALPLPVVARRLGLDPAATTAELAQARDLFRDRCRRDHLDGRAGEGCGADGRLWGEGALGAGEVAACGAGEGAGPDAGEVAGPDAAEAAASGIGGGAATPGAGEAAASGVGGPAVPGAGTGAEMSRHLAGCADCAEAAGCLRTDPGAVSAALADGVIGWGGLAYLERRRRAAEVRRAAGRPAPPDEDCAPPDHGTRRTRAVRGGLLATAALISLLALTASLRPFGDTADAGHDTAATAAPTATAGRRPLPAAPPASTTAPEATPDGSRTPTGTTRRAPEPKPQGTGTAPPTPTPTTAPVTVPTPSATATTPACEIHYDLVNQWPDGFQATVTLTTPEALDTWRVSWTFPDGQRITQMWDATPSQDGSRVTVTAAAYNVAVPAGGTLSFGFLAAWSGHNEAPGAFTLNGRTCAGG